MHTIYWIKPTIDRNANTTSFTVQDNSIGVPDKSAVNRNTVTCMACNASSPLSYVRKQSKLGNMGKQMTAIVAKGSRNRIFFSPTQEHIRTALSVDKNINIIPQQKIPATAYKISGTAYGITHWHELFTDRQLGMLTTFLDIVPGIRNKIVAQCKDPEYANTVCTYLALMVGKLVDSHNSFATYLLPRENVRNVFARQAIPMAWDFAEGNPFANAAGTLSLILDKITRVVEALAPCVSHGTVRQADASTTMYSDKDSVVVTDPPYYDNISYGELSDFFYVWLRPLLRDIYPELFASIAAPINEEMIAAPRFENTSKRFENLMNKTLHLVRDHSNPEFPVSIFYAYKQQEDKHNGRRSTGWDTMLSALVDAGFQIVGTWPMRTEFSGRSNAIKANSLASSIILVCRMRPANAESTTRRKFMDCLKTELLLALTRMQASSIAPVDLAQATIGPGMSVFTRYAKVLDANGDVVSVREALSLINQTLDEILADQEGDFDADTRWALSWFGQCGFNKEDFGMAETLSKAKNTSVSGMVEAGILEAGMGKVRLLRPRELPEDWDPKKDKRFTVWEATHHLIRVLDQGEDATADLMANLGPASEAARELAYRLYHTCEQKNYSQEAQDYDALVQSWPEISRLARDITLQQTYSHTGMKQYDDR